MSRSAPLSFVKTITRALRCRVHGFGPSWPGVARRSLLTFILIVGTLAGVFVWRQAGAANTHEKSSTLTRAYAATGGKGTITNVDAPPLVVYVDDDWAAVPNGTDPDAAGPATAMGLDAFATIQAGINGVASGGTVNVHAGIYPESVLVDKSVTLLGAQAGQDANTRFAAFD